MSKKNFITVLISTFLSILLCYFLFFLKIHFEYFHKDTFRFRSINTLNFNKNYYNKLHHLRDANQKWEIESKPEIYLFSIINKFSINTDNILLQGDSWIQQLNGGYYKKSYNLINNFAKKNDLGLINAGVTSFSPSLMQLQYEILEKDFNIKPNIVVAYFDQTDVGDELCRYKDKRVYDKNNTLVAVKKENYSRATYDYTKIFYISEIALLDDSSLIRTFKFTNFFIKYGFLRFIDKSKSIRKNGWKNVVDSKCRVRKILKYLSNSNDNEVSFFEDRIKDYINLLINKEYIEKIILVTFPHKEHLYNGYDISNNEKNHYSINVSNIIEKIVKNEKKIYHLNFSKLIFERKVHLDNNAFVLYDLASHLKEKYHATIFTQEIINLLE